MNANETSEAFCARMDREFSRAREMQLHILPSRADLEAVGQHLPGTICSLFEPFGEVGGDLWGVEELDRRRVAMFVVDCSGHQLPSSLNAFRVHSLLSMIHEKRDDPAHVLGVLNRHLCRLLPVGQHAAMAYAVVDADNDMITYAGSAFPWPLVVQSDGSPVVGDGSGLPLGIVEGAEYENRTLPFPKDSLFLLYSDGLNEFKPDHKEPMRLEGVIAFAQALLASPKPQKLLADLHKRVKKTKGECIDDDFTVLCCKRER